MLFTPENAKKVMDGAKTQTRRPEQEGDTVKRHAGLGCQTKLVAVYRNGRLLWEVGKAYAVQPGRGKSAIGRIKLISIRRERVNAISEEDAKAEGVEPFNSPAIGIVYKPAFVSLWNSIYSDGLAYHTGPMVWVLEFERVAGQ